MSRETRSGLTSLPIGHIDFEDDETTVSIETKLGRVHAGESDELLLRGPLVPRGKGSLAGDAEGFVSTGLRAEVEPGDSGRLRIKRDAGGKIVTVESLQTSMSGVFAIGAVRAGYGGLLTDAIADAQTAASAVGAHLGK